MASGAAAGSGRRVQRIKVEIENEARRGELLEASAVEREWATIATATKRAVLSLPGRLLQLGVIGVDKLGVTTEACTDALRHLGRA